MHLFMFAFICVCIYLLPFFKEYIMRLRRKDSEICMYIYTIHGMFPKMESILLL